MPLAVCQKAKLKPQIYLYNNSRIVDFFLRDKLTVGPFLVPHLVILFNEV